MVLHPNSETLWSDVCAMNAKAEKHWTDAEALEVEAKILVSTGRVSLPASANADKASCS